MASVASVSGFSGTPLYAAPEMIDESFGRVSEKTDVWQVGCLLYEMIGGKPPFKANNPIKLAREIVEGAPKKIESRAWRMISLMLEKRPEDRISTEDALEEIRIERKYGKIVEALKKGAIINRELAEAYGDDFDELVSIAEGG